AASAVEGGVIARLLSREGEAQTSAAVATALGARAGDGLPAVIARAIRSVVAVRVVSARPGFFGTVQVRGQGSGVIVGPDRVVTNAHVVEGATSVEVVFDGGERAAATVLGADPVHDLAVLSVPTGDRPTIPLGRSSSLRLGDTVIALGYPLGLGPTATRGIVSGLDRTIDVSDGAGGVEHLEGLLQTDAAINPGNSGGPLIDAAGRLVGINTAGASASAAENVGFAIAIDEALPILGQLQATAA
ncbi:MAG TPA: trypsin-like peptidase domain-containing protein, partial [Actinomycetota bacterium]|nr:trypsin-like peptidase domain-containing protein [Actinomycetota bacterium]